MNRLPIELPSEEVLRNFCNRHQIIRFSLFGSVLRNDFTPSSDVDVLIEFAPGKRIGLFGLAEIELELTDLFGRKVDLNTRGSLSPYFREEVPAEAEPLYVAP
jgi:predicted nucleotidyltransferase